MDTDIEAVIRDLRLDDEVIDPTTLTGEEMVKEVQRVVKALLGYGAKLPKELMLYVKNMVFLDGAIARLAPDLDILAEVREHLDAVRPEARRTGSGVNSVSTRRRRSSTWTACAPSTGLELEREPADYRELQQRRELIQRRMRDHVETRAPAEAERRRTVRLVIARCSVDYSGRLDAHLPQATRLIMAKADGCVAIDADGGAQKPLNWMNAAEHARRQR